jgi:hypothetical protein
LKEGLKASPIAYGSKQTQWTLKCIKDCLLRDLKICSSTVWKTLKRLGINLKRSALRQRSPDPAYYEKLKIIEDFKKEAIVHPDKMVIIPEDEASLHRIPSLARTYAEKGSCPPLQGQGVSDETRTIFGAVNGLTGETFFMEALTGCDTNYIKFLEQIISLNPGRKIGLITDNWGVHFSHASKNFYEEHKECLCVLRLPTYAPFLNPEEKIWKDMRKNVTHNHPYNVMSEVLQQFRTWSENSQKNPELILKLISYFKEPFNVGQ